MTRTGDRIDLENRDALESPRCASVSGFSLHANVDIDLEHIAPVAAAGAGFNPLIKIWLPMILVVKIPPYPPKTLSRPASAEPVTSTAGCIE